MLLKDMLQVCGLDLTKRIKVARHIDKDIDVQELYEKGNFELYQSYQGKNSFNCDYIVSFLGLENSQAVFVGVYEVKNPTEIIGLPQSIDTTDELRKRLSKAKWKYDLEKVDGFETLENRVIVQWEGVATSWCRHLNTFNLEVLQMLPKGETKKFTGYLDFILKRWELESIINSPSKYKAWQESLSIVSGVYLIVDNKTGKQYVGSAYGEEGIWGRWKTYVDNGHGGNKMLKAILNVDPDRVKDFTYTILQVLPNTYKDKEVFKIESLYKRKLGSRAFGLNGN
ncbi:GIY-YIG nuclease family protein [Bacillus toyonensis]|uniref:GIY-YIG nuclease family protein n=1 Tax=Bacillus toyonensis TaxID=155322 RepID=UPI000BF5FDE4|nr:GIY-YIG nuclease family protein [Bacillus toyonensis]PGF05060.1 excinuclease ABC subunit C [Bacillus toyonensis]